MPQATAPGRRLPDPHGGGLRPLLLEGQELAQAGKRAGGLPVIPLGSQESSDLVMLATGAFSPLGGFMCREDYLGVVERMQCADGTLWPIPVTLAVSAEQASRVREGQEAALLDTGSGELLGVLEVRDKFRYDRGKEAREVFHTEDRAHPGVGRLFEQGEVYLGGAVKAFSEGRFPRDFPEYARPAETRALFLEKGWSEVTAFQTRNPLHRSHEYLLRVALEISDGVLLHPIVGALKPGDIPAEVRMRCYEALLQGYLPRERVVLRVYPMQMRYGGPREAVLHAIIRQNFGCSRIIIGRDHAGVGSYYGPFDAQAIFEQLPPGALQIRPLKLDWTFWCRRCGAVASPRTCPHEKRERLLISGTELRSLLAAGRKPPPEFSRPEVLDILLEYYRNNQEQK